MSDISENNKRIAKNTLLLYFRMLLTMAISLYTSRLVLATLGEIDYGIYNVVGGFVTMFAVISGAMTTATQRFLSFEIGKKEGGDVHSVFSTAVIIHLILGLIILLCAETIGLWFLNNYMNFPEERYVAANWVFQFSVLTFIINVVSVPYNAAIIAYERMKAFAYVSIIEVTLKLLVVYLLIISSSDKLILYSILLALIAIAIRIVYGVYAKRNFKECNFDWSWDRMYGKNVMAFVSWNLIGSLAGVAKEQGINVILNIFFGAAVNAARGISYQVSGALNGFVNNFQLAMNPQIVKSYASNDKDNMFKLVFRGSKFSYLLILTLSLPVIIEAPFILKIWLKEVPEYTIIFLRLVLIIALIDSLSGTLITTMHASGKVKDYQIIVGGISLLTLPIAYVILKLGYPPYAAMYVGILISIICHFARLLLLKRSVYFPVSLFIKNVTVRVSIISLLSLIIPVFVFLYVNESWFSFLLVCLISFISTSFFSYSIGLTRNEKVFVINKLSVLIRKIKE